MKKVSIFLTLAMLICLLAACGSGAPSDTSASSKPTESSPSATESTQTDILYAVFSAEDIKEYPIEYTGAQKTAEELAHELSELTGLDFTITASKAEDGWIVDWAADSTLIAGRDDREQKKEFHFFDHDSMSWFMMDSLWRTLTKNLDTENIYYTMDGGRELALEKMSPANVFPADIPYMGSEFYLANSNMRGDEENPLDTQAAYQGFWKYPDGKILEINGDKWNLYADDRLTLLADGPVEYMEGAACLMNADGSSGGGRVFFDENNNLTDSGEVLTYHGKSLSGGSTGDVPRG